MNQLDILCFTLVARTCSFSATARELRISQQAVSRHIRTLEEELGFPLFLRNYQNVQLTGAGERMLRYFEEREALMNELHDRFRSAREDQILRVAWSQWLGAPQWFRDILHRFRAQYPEVKLQTYDLSAEEMAEALQREEIDLLLTTRYSAGYLPVAWSTTEIGSEPIVLVASRRVELDMSSCSLLPFFATYAGEFNEQGVLARVQKECECSGIYPRRIEVCPNMGTVCLNVLTCGGLTLGVNIPPLARSDEFVIHPTGRMATVVLCRPFLKRRKEAELLERFILQETEGRA